MRPRPLLAASRQLEMEVNELLQLQQQKDHDLHLYPDYPDDVSANHHGDQKLEVSVGPCLLQLYEDCRDTGSIIFYLFR